MDRSSGATDRGGFVSLSTAAIKALALLFLAMIIFNKVTFSELTAFSANLKFFCDKAENTLWLTRKGYQI